MHAEQRLQPGDELGGYTLIRPLGTGGTGQVWEVRDAGGYVFALKLLHPNLAMDETARLRLAREAQILARINNPGVLYVCDLEVDGTDPFVVTELIRGHSLKEEIERNGAYNLTQALEIAQRLAQILTAVHAEDVVHRDFKPSNILLGPDGPVLIDFGIAQLETDDRFTHTGLVSGTPGWVSPEVITGKAPSTDSDWWGWTATLLYMLTGRVPFGTGSWPTILSRVAIGQADTAGLNPAVSEWLLAGLAPNSRGPRPSYTEILNGLTQVNLEPQTQVLAAPEQHTQVLPTPTTQTQILPTPAPTTPAPTELLPVTVETPVETEILPITENYYQGTSLENSHTYPDYVPQNPNTYPQANVGDYPEMPLGNMLGNPPQTPLAQPTEPTYKRKHVPLISGTLLFLTLGALPFALGIIGIITTASLLLLFTLIGLHRAWLRRKENEFGQLRTRDRALAWLRLPLHLVQGALGLLLTVGLTQVTVIAGWYLSSVKLGWPGMEYYQQTLLRPTHRILTPEIWWGPDLNLVLGALYLSGAISVIASLLGPTGKEIREGAAAILTGLIPWTWLRFIIITAITIPIAYLILVIFAGITIQ
ncbi:kinase domain protein [Gleimia coleocanis DSM 15436]|uniref:Kinase domain protein n=1 Tax=Gleimia coleocanis DSM 15436 TaxID=525245 RepID=C0VYH5_9ACTO|nr:serine/threonine-protein kinase [Gleimia coleocanis]EEH64478.1 kinase domain protein [Gleimia coleocanis DSM 15436]